MFGTIGILGMFGTIGTVIALWNFSGKFFVRILVMFQYIIAILKVVIKASF